jgi:hypothetical protein
MAVCAALLVVTGSATATTTVSNGVYTAVVQDTTDFSSIGSWTAYTGASHPTGAGNDLLYREGGGSVTTTTNFSSLRVYGAAGVTDYTFGGSGGGVDLDPSVVSEGASPFGVNGHRTRWGVTAAGLDVVQDVVVVGSTFANSGIYHTVEIVNNNQNPVSVGWRNLYDWQVDDPGTDDGPNNAIELSSGAVVVPATTLSFSHTPAGADFARVSVDPGTPSYQPLLGLGFDPALHGGLATTAPDEYAYVSWPGAFGTAFDYTPTGLDVTGDSAGLSWFGRDAARAVAIAPGGSVRFTQTIFGVEPDQPPPVIPEPLTVMGLCLGVSSLTVYLRKRGLRTV